MNSGQVARVWVYKQGKPPRSRRIDGGMVLGRGESCDLVLDDETVSTDHAEVTRHGTRYLIADLGSLNGTVVNGRTIDRPTRLAASDVVQIGPFRLEFELPKGGSTRLKPTPAVDLTDDERAVARALVAPYRQEDTLAGRPATRREIAEQLHLSESTVKRRLDSLAHKLRLTDDPRDRMRGIADRVLALGLDQS